MTLEHDAPHRPIEAALTAGEDLVGKARGLKDLHRHWSENSSIPELVRPIVARSWSRAGSLKKVIEPLDATDVRERRESNLELGGLVDLFKARLLSLATQAGNQLVVSDSQGFVLWVLGPSGIRRQSDGIGFVAGARWRESDVGTNGIGTAMEESAPVQIFGPEHAREEQHNWVCTSAPVRNGATSALVGAITLAGSFRTAHPHSLALVSSVAREAEMFLQVAHMREMQKIEFAAQLPQGEYVLVDSQGSVAAARGYSVGAKINLPTTMAEGRNWVPGLGAIDAQQTPRGWLLQRSDEAVSLQLDTGTAFQVVVHSREGVTRISLSAKHWLILELLAAHPQGMSSSQLSSLWPANTPSVTIRAEISRLRSKLPGLIASRPYRIVVPVVGA